MANQWYFSSHVALSSIVNFHAFVPTLFHLNALEPILVPIIEMTLETLFHKHHIIILVYSIVMELRQVNATWVHTVLNIHVFLSWDVALVEVLALANFEEWWINTISIPFLLSPIPDILICHFLMTRYSIDQIFDVLSQE